MQRLKIIACSFICMMLIMAYIFSDKYSKAYSVTIESFTENGSYVEYPQIEGLGDKEKQARINDLLKEQVYTGAKNYLYQTFVDFSDPEYIYEFRTYVRFANRDIASFSYSFDAHGMVNGVLQDNSRYYGVTIDMKTGEKLKLQDFMVVDERLINSTDGTNYETDYKSAVTPTIHKAKDFFGVYFSEDEEDIFHTYTPQQVIDKLKNPQGEANWYIDESRKIAFTNGQYSIHIPYDQLSDIIYPHYLESLSKE